MFLYLPFEHSEDLADQERSVELTAALGDEEYARYAVLHRDVIKRFGRFPHRNAMLGRTPTLEEIKFLEGARQLVLRAARAACGGPSKG